MRPMNSLTSVTGSSFGLATTPTAGGPPPGAWPRGPREDRCGYRESRQTGRPVPRSSTFTLALRCRNRRPQNVHEGTIGAQARFLRRTLGTQDNLHRVGMLVFRCGGGRCEITQLAEALASRPMSGREVCGCGQMPLISRRSSTVRRPHRFMLVSPRPHDRRRERRLRGYVRLRAGRLWSADPFRTSFRPRPKPQKCCVDSLQRASRHRRTRRPCRSST